jgi:hypothetical protein
MFEWSNIAASGYLSPSISQSKPIPDWLRWPTWTPPTSSFKLRGDRGYVGHFLFFRCQIFLKIYEENKSIGVIPLFIYVW